MATYSSNVSIKFETGVTLTGSASYTVPANSYAIIGFFEIVCTSGGNASLSAGGITVASVNQSGEVEKSFSPIYVPAGTTVTTYVNGAKGTIANAILTVFKNTP